MYTLQDVNSLLNPDIIWSELQPKPSSKLKHLMISLLKGVMKATVPAPDFET